MQLKHFYHSSSPPKVVRPRSQASSCRRCIVFILFLRLAALALDAYFNRWNVMILSIWRHDNLRYLQDTGSLHFFTPRLVPLFLSLVAVTNYRSSFAAQLSRVHFLQLFERNNFHIKRMRTGEITQSFILCCHVFIISIKGEAGSGKVDRAIINIIEQLIRKRILITAPND